MSPLDFIPVSEEASGRLARAPSETGATIAEGPLRSIYPHRPTS